MTCHDCWVILDQEISGSFLHTWHIRIAEIQSTVFVTSGWALDKRSGRNAQSTKKGLLRQSSFFDPLRLLFFDTSCLLVMGCKLHVGFGIIGLQWLVSTAICLAQTHWRIYLSQVNQMTIAAFLRHNVFFFRTKMVAMNSTSTQPHVKTLGLRPRLVLNQVDPPGQSIAFVDLTWQDETPWLGQAIPNVLNDKSDDIVIYIHLHTLFF